MYLKMILCTDVHLVAVVYVCSGQQSLPWSKVGKSKDACLYFRFVNVAATAATYSKIRGLINVVYIWIINTVRTYVRSTLQSTRAWYNGYNADWLCRWVKNNTTSNNLMTTPYDRCMDVKEIHNA